MEELRDKPYTQNLETQKRDEVVQRNWQLRTWPKLSEEFRQKYGGTVILKGSGSLVSSHDGPDWLCGAGNPGMASPGMGDVLTCIVAAMRAQGLAPELAAVAAVEIHAQAGDVAAVSGQRGLLASDLIQELRVWVNR